jgi:N-ethylmaleimide reductase
MKPSIEYKIFEDYNLQGINLKNRVVMAPLTRSRAIGNIPNEMMATYYSQRAGAGLIFSEGTAPSPNGIGYPRIPGIYSREQIDGWKIVTSKVHEMGGKIFCQLMHSGRVSHPDNMPEGAKVMGPSSVQLTNTKMYVDGKGEIDIPSPTEMTIQEIEDTIDEYSLAAQNAIEAGFDGVEIHGANGYLIDQFFNPASNKRTDEYGGSSTNRSRFGLKVAEAITRAIGSDRTGIRLSPYGVMNEMEIYDDIHDFFLHLATQLNRLDLAYIHLTDHSSMGAPKVPEEVKREIRMIFSNTIILCGGFDKERAEKILKEDRADLIAFGRMYIANPDLVGRMVENARLTIPNADLFYTPGEKGYIDYPYLKKEVSY